MSDQLDDPGIPTTTTTETVVGERMRFARPPASDDPPLPPTEGPAPDVDEPTRPVSPRTATSTRAVQREMAEGMGRAVTGLLGMLYLAGRVGLRLVNRRLELRAPTPAEYAAVGNPVGRILARHVPMDLAPDLILDIMDASEAAGGVVAYLDGSPEPSREAA